ncbi:MAG: hypothetical protein ACW98D_18525 [Promethearchaeota archaeon]|jgi:hypothetical protein
MFVNKQFNSGDLVKHYQSGEVCLKFEYEEKKGIKDIQLDILHAHKLIHGLKYIFDNEDIYREDLNSYIVIDEIKLTKRNLNKIQNACLSLEDRNGNLGTVVFEHDIEFNKIKFINSKSIPSIYAIYDVKSGKTFHAFNHDLVLINNNNNNLSNKHVIFDSTKNELENSQLNTFEKFIKTYSFNDKCIKKVFYKIAFQCGYFNHVSLDAKRFKLRRSPKRSDETYRYDLLKQSAYNKFFKKITTLNHVLDLEADYSSQDQKDLENYLDLDSTKVTELSCLYNLMLLLKLDYFNGKRKEFKSLIFHAYMYGWARRQICDIIYDRAITLTTTNLLPKKINMAHPDDDLKVLFDLYYDRI